MLLRDYLHFNRITQTRFAELVGYSKSYIDAIANQKYIPSKRLAKLICEKTNGQVTFEDLGLIRETQIIETERFTKKFQI